MRQETVIRKEAELPRGSRLHACVLCWCCRAVRSRGGLGREAGDRQGGALAWGAEAPSSGSQVPGQQLWPLGNLRMQVELSQPELHLQLPAVNIDTGLGGGFVGSLADWLVWGRG